jgi:hypothetical protein
MTADSLRAIGVGASMVHYHTIGLDHFGSTLVNPTVGVSMVHGHVYPLFPWAVSLFAVPWIVGYDILHKVGIGSGSLSLVRSGHDWELQVVSMSAVVAATSVVIYAIALRLLRITPLVRRRRWALGVALAFAFATPVWTTASRSMWQHGPSIFFVAVALLCALRAQAGQHGWIGMGVALGCSYAVRPTDSIPVAILFLWVLLAHRRHIVALTAGLVPPLLVFVTVNKVAYGTLLTPYYRQGQGFGLSRTMGEAMAGNLISPGRGLFIYCPLVVLSVIGVTKYWSSPTYGPFWKALALIPVLHWLVISAFKHWWGGDSYGPRFFTDMMPILAVLALPVVDQLASLRFRKRWALSAFTGVALVSSLVIHAQGATLRSAWCWNNEPTDVDAHSAKVWSWSDPQFARGARRIVFGPNRHSELRRDGVDLIGCPKEPVKP